MTQECNITYICKHSELYSWKSRRWLTHDMRISNKIEGEKLYGNNTSQQVVKVVGWSFTFFSAANGHDHNTLWKWDNIVRPALF